MRANLSHAYVCDALDDKCLRLLLAEGATYVAYVSTAPGQHAAYVHYKLRQATPT